MSSSFLESPIPFTSSGPAPGVRAIEQQRDGVFVIYPQADFGLSTLDDGAWFNYAFGKVQQLSPFSPVTVRCCSGRVFNIKTTVNVPSPGIYFDLNGSTLAGNAAGLTVVSMLGPNNAGTPLSYSQFIMGSSITNGIIDGTATGTNSTGLLFGNGDSLQAWQIRVCNFIQTGSVGIWETNNKPASYTEKQNIRVETYNCLQHYLIDAPGSSDNSHFYGYWDIHMDVQTGQNGLKMQNSAGIRGGHMRIRGNYYPGSGANSVWLDFSGTNGHETCHIDTSFLEIHCEVTGSGASQCQTIKFGTNTASAGIHNCLGMILFSTGASTWIASDGVAGQLSFSGYINDATLRGINQPIQGSSPGMQPVNASPANPGSLTNTTLTHMGLGSNCQFTPTGSGNVFVEIRCNASTATANVPFTIGGRHADSTVTPVPTHAQNPAVGARINLNADENLQAAATAQGIVVVYSMILTGLTPGNLHWLDIVIATSNAADAAQVQNVSMVAYELPGIN